MNLIRKSRLETEYNGIISEFQIEIDYNDYEVKKVTSKDGDELKYLYMNFTGYITLYNQDVEEVIVKVAKKPVNRYNFEKDPKTGESIGCIYENSSWCELPKYQRCRYCIRCKDGSKACQVKI